MAATSSDSKKVLDGPEGRLRAFFSSSSSRSKMRCQKGAHSDRVEYSGRFFLAVTNMPRLNHGMPQQKHLFETTIQQSQLDSYGHVNHAAYLQIFEQARWEFTKNHGYGYEVVHAQGVGPIVLRIQIEFRKELRLGQTLRVETYGSGFKKRIFKVYQSMVDGQGDICCRAEYSLALFDMKERKIISPTKHWLDAMGSCG
ncbi:MAG: acyl-CoA thioesterase [Deltaproteobacteria bacterium]|nr:acyl-CoA thioesterase [Deltaproteobacteria bacterium]